MPDGGTVLLLIIILPAIAFLLAVALRPVADNIAICLKAEMFVSGGLFVPKDKGARFAYKGVVNCFKQNYVKAVFFLEKAMKYSYDPQNCVFCLDWMTKCYDAQGKPDRSLDCCIKAVEVFPSNIPSLFNLAERYLGRGKFDKARYYYETVLKYDEKNNYAKFMTGVTDMLSGEYARASEIFAPLEKISEQLPIMSSELAVIAALLGDMQKSREFSESAKKGGYEEPERLSGRLDCIERMRELCLNDS